jgi:hypothetical protein
MLRTKSWPAHGWFGLGLVIVFWALNWALPGLHTHWAFFPLWLGYCLLVDALVYVRKGHSLLTRRPAAYAGMFAVSIPGWWLFELVNQRTQNWHYQGMEFFTAGQYFALTSLSFSTVMPAVFGTAELVSTFSWMTKIGPGPRIAPRRPVLLAFFLAGCTMLVVLLLWPRTFFPLVWISIYFILEPINCWLGNRSLAAYTAERDWRPVLALWIGCLICGFFWEMWNFYSYPKWVYHVPLGDFLRVFEMPLLGYGGYLPFSLELFALYHLIASLFKSAKAQDVIQISPDPGPRVGSDKGM